MIQIKSNIKTLMANWDKRVKKVKKAQIDSQKKAARLVKLYAMKFAPKRAGGILRGLRVEHRKKYSRVISSVFKSFPYQFWVNETTPYKRIRLIPHFRPKGRKKQVSFSYREVARTGSPRYFDMAGELVAKQFPKLTFEFVHRALKETQTKG